MLMSTQFPAPTCTLLPSPTIISEPNSKFQANSTGEKLSLTHVIPASAIEIGTKENQIAVSMKAGSSMPARMLCKPRLAGQLGYWRPCLPKSLIAHQSRCFTDMEIWEICRHCPRNVIQDFCCRPVPPSTICCEPGGILLALHRGAWLFPCKCRGEWAAPTLQSCATKPGWHRATTGVCSPARFSTKSSETRLGQQLQLSPHLEATHPYWCRMESPLLKSIIAPKSSGLAQFASIRPESCSSFSVLSDPQGPSWLSALSYSSSHAHPKLSAIRQHNPLPSLRRASSPLWQ